MDGAAVEGVVGAYICGMVAAVVGSAVLAVHVARDGGGEVEGDGRAHQQVGGDEQHG